MNEKKTFEVDCDLNSASRIMSHAAGRDSDGMLCGFALRKAVVYKLKGVVNLVFAADDGFEISVWATPSGPSPCHFKTKNLNLTIQTGRKDRKSRGRAMAMMEEFGRLFKDATIADFERGIIEKAGGRKRPDFSAMTDLNLFFDTWGDPARSTQFFFYDAVWRYYFVCYSYRHEGSINVLDKSMYVTHGDAECPRNFYFNLPGLDKFFAFPWNADRDRNTSLRENHSAVYTTDLDDIDIIDGGMKKLSELLRKIGDNPDFKVVFVNATCLAVIIGDDVESAIRELRERAGVAVILLNALNMSVFGHLKELINFGEKMAEGASAPVTTINLLGFMKNRGLDELKALLGDIGLTVNKCFLPDIEFFEMEKYLDAGLQIIHPGKAYADMTEKVFANLPMKSVTPAAPCGIGGTWSFLETVSRAAGTTDRLEEIRKKTQPEIDERWRRVVEKCERHRIGIVADSLVAELLCDTEITWGIPLAATLEEMGFELHFFLETRDAEKDSRVVRSMLKNPGKHKVSTFQGLSELEALLREPDAASAVYSDIYYDNRLSRCGKTGFSINIFEPGFEGAFRTAEKLLALCEAPFLKRYAAHMTSDGGAFHD